MRRYAGGDVATGIVRVLLSLHPVTNREKDSIIILLVNILLPFISNSRMRGAVEIFAV
jgi:hypothetical protein